MRLTRFLTTLVASVFMLACSAHAATDGLVIPKRDQASREAGQRSPQLQQKSAAAPWIRKAEHEGTVYLLYSFPARVERFSLASRQWLAPIVLSAVPRGLAVSDKGIFVSQNTKVSRFNLDGSGESTLANAWNDASDVAIIGDYLLTSKDDEIQSLRISTGTQVAIYTSPGGYYTPNRMAATQTGVIFGWQEGSYPSDILRIPLRADGTFGQYMSSPYHGDYPAGSTVFADPDGAHILDDAGIAFNGTTLIYRSGTGGPIRDAIVTQGRRHLVRNDSIALLDTEFREIGIYLPSAPANAIAADATNVYLFREDGGKPAAEVVPIEAFAQRETSTPPNPETTPYIVDHVDMADDGTLHLFDRAQRVVHRFAIPQWRYLESTALPSDPQFISVDRKSGDVHVAYTGGRIGIIRSGSNQEDFFAFGPITVRNMGAADGLLLTVDSTGAWNSHRIYNAAGMQTDWKDWNYFGREFAWSRANRRFYFYRDDTSPNDLHYERISVDGKIIEDGETPYHGEVSAILPIRPSPNGAYVVLGSGQVYDGMNLTRIGTLPEQPIDVAWVGQTMYSLHASSNPATSRLVRWTASNTVAEEVTFAGTSPRLFAFDGQLVTIARVDGHVRFRVWGPELASVFSDGFE